MQLRNGKTTMKRNNSVLEKPVLMRNPKMYIDFRNEQPSHVNLEIDKKEISEFKSELQAMMDELNEWDTKEARIAGIIDIYDFIFERGNKLQDFPSMAKFFIALKSKINEHLGELIGLAFKCIDDEETVANIKMARDSILAVARMLKNR